MQRLTRLGTLLWTKLKRMDRHHVPRSDGRKPQSKMASATRGNVVHRRERFVGDLTSLVQDLCLKLYPLERISVVIVQGAHDRCVASSCTLQLPFDPEEALL